MPKILDGKEGPLSGRFAIIVSRYNEHITAKLLSGAVETLLAAGIPDDAIDVCWVPGAWEIPLIAQQMANSGSYVALLCLGAVIRGETTHDEHINRQVSPASASSPSKPNSPSSSASSPATPSSKPSTAPAAMSATRARSVPRPRSRWCACFKNLAERTTDDGQIPSNRRSLVPAHRAGRGKGTAAFGTRHKCLGRRRAALCHHRR
jgi:6,7-dimethyl-8-ribityllumazine synthase